MEYSQIILEMLERIKVLENRVNALEGGSKPEEGPIIVKTEAKEKISAKYYKLADYLLSSGKKSVTLSYEEIEKILGFSLPLTAREFKHSFWANTKTHSYSSSWMAVGYRTRVNIDADEVTFYKELL